MSDHPWCRDVARDEAVRAAEDAVPRPAVLNWRDIPERVAALEAMIAKIVSGSSAESHENKGERMRESTPAGGLPADRSSGVVFSRRHAMASEAREWCEENGVPASPVNVVTALFSLGLVALPSAAEAEAEVERLRDRLTDAEHRCDGYKLRVIALVTERDTLKARVAALEREVAAMRAPVEAEADAEVERLKCDACSRSFSFEEFNGGTRRLVEPDNAFGPEQWETLCPACVCKDAIRERDAALARVAELEAAADHFADASKMGEPDAEPVAWATCCSDGSNHYVWCMRENADEKARQVGGTVVPLYRSPPQPRGWLTEEEREAVRFFADWKNGEVRMVEEIEQQRPILDDLLARNSPPKVRLPECPFTRYGNASQCRGSGWDMAVDAVRAALAAAGVEVEE